jgi:polyisoprenoid-binding protein YceI
MAVEIDGTNLPLTPGTWTLDPNHSGVHFKVRHIGITNVRGRFNVFSATLEVGEALATTRVNATIDMSSVDTNQSDRDASLRSSTFFSTELHPQMEFHSLVIQRAADEGYEVEGELTINGVTQTVTLAVDFDGLQEFPVDHQLHAGFTATTEINRDDFGIDFSVPLSADRFVVGKRITIELDLQFVAPH